LVLSADVNGAEAKAQLNYVTGVTYGGKLLHGYLRADTGIGGDPSVGAAIRVGVQEPDIKALPSQWPRQGWWRSSFSRTQQHWPAWLARASRSAWLKLMQKWRVSSEASVIRGCHDAGGEGSG
jgi:hypothetical protein